MGKNHFLHLCFFFIITTSVYSFSTIINKNNLLNTNYKNLDLPPSVDFSFTDDGTCSGTPITFTPNVIGNGPFIYKWDFGDGITSTNNYPIHSFTALGCDTQTFSVKLTVTDANGEVSSLTKDISVKQKPDLKFVNSDDPKLGTSFERCGNSINPKYTINIDNASNSKSCVTTYNVDWGDGILENDISFPKSHDYQKLGAFNMVITGIGNNSCSNSITTVVKNSNNPKGALITPGNTTNLCIPAPMEFLIGSWGLNPSDTKYNIDFGDKTILKYTQADLEKTIYYNSTNPESSQNFPIPHTYITGNCPSGNTVLLTITTTCGYTYLTAGPIQILDTPNIAFTVKDIVCSNTPITFINTTAAGYSTNCSTTNVYTWDFGDGTPTSTEVSPTHTYINKTKKNYTITLKAETICGVGIQATKTICVEPILQPKFTYSNACASTNVQITNSTDASQGCALESYEWKVIQYEAGFCGELELWNFVNGTNKSSKDPVFNFTNPGTYHVQMTTKNACGIENTVVELIQVKMPPVTTLSTISDYCNSTTINPIGTVEACSPNSEITYLWSFPGGNPPTSTALIPGAINYSNSGKYTVTFSATNTCGTTTKTTDFSVALVLKPIITPKSTRIYSEETFEVIPVTNATDNVPPGTTYIWSPPVISPAGSVSGASAQYSSLITNISQTLINTTNQSATVTYTVIPMSAACPGSPFVITVTVNPIIKAIEVIKNNSCFGSNNASINMTVTGGNLLIGNFYIYSWKGPDGYTSTQEDIYNLKPGAYELIITDNGTRTFNKTYYVSEPGLFQFSVVKNDITCFGLNNGNINLSTTGGTQPYTYVWTKDGNTYPETSGNINNLKAGTYGITITEVNNCNTLTGSYTIEESLLLKVSLVSKVDILCYGYSTGEINVTTTGGRPIEISPNVYDYKYSWTGPYGFNSNLQNLKNLAAGNYYLTVTDNSGCTDNFEVVLLQNDEILLDYSKTEIVCNSSPNASITINTITGGIPNTTGDPYLIEWSNLGTGQVQNNLSAGNYTITITDALGCPKQFTITIENAPVFTIKPDIKEVSCFGAKDGHILLNLTGGKTPVTLVWDDDSTAGVERNNLGPGIYNVTINDAKSCEINETFIITEPLLLELSATITNPLDCLDATTGEINLNVSGGSPPYAYLWSSGSKTKDLNKLTSGSYAVTVTDTNGCKKLGEYQLTRFEKLTPSIEVLTNFNCDSKYVYQTFIGHAKGGIPPYTLKWSDGVITGINNEIMNTNKNGLILFTVNDSYGCTSTIPYDVALPDLGIANYSTSSYAKNTYNWYSIYDPILFTNLATGDFTNISWDFDDGTFSNEENPNHIYKREGTYAIKQTATYPFGCQYSYTSTLVVEKGYSLIMPNAFTPNNDGYNDTFAPVSIGLKSITLDVYDTWGGIVYSETGKIINGWNGKIKDQTAENGNYYFKITAKTFYNDVIIEKGGFTLLK